MKMENYSLKTLLDSVLITPVTDELIAHLDDVCTKYVSDISNEGVDECVRSFVNQTVNADLEELCKLYDSAEDDAYEENEDSVDSDEVEEDRESILSNLPPIINIVMSGYCCQRLCEDKQSIKAAICSLSLMNIVKQYWFNPARLLFPEMISNMYFRYDCYQEIMINGINKLKETELIVPLIFKDGIDIESIEDSTKFHAEIQSLAYYASKYHVEEFIKDNIIESGSQQPYNDVYKSICSIINATPWIYLNNNPKSIVGEITPNLNGNSKKTLKDILAEINDISIIEDFQPLSQSSILLNLICKKELTGREALLNKKISVQQFAIALYYELLLETLLKEH